MRSMQVLAVSAVSAPSALGKSALMRPMMNNNPSHGGKCRNAIVGKRSSLCAGNAIAMEIILNGLDSHASVDVQDRARAVLAEYKSAIAPPEIRPKNLMSMGQGRRKQIVTTIIDTDEEAHVGWLIQQVLRRQITALEASNKLLQAVRRRGAKESLAVLASGVARLIGKRT